MASDLLREIPIDEQLPPFLRDTFVRAILAAELTGTDDSTIRRHLRNGTLDGSKINGRWLVSRNALKSWEPGQPGRPVMEGKGFA